jgi:O-antigen/teichoic acid export membrane protein
MPMEIISKAISRVLIQQVASNKNQKAKMRKLGIRVLESLSVLSIFPMAAIGLTAPEVFYFAFGEQWNQAGVFASLLCFWGICGFIFPPFFEITSIFNKQHVFLIYNIISFFLRFLALVIGGAIFNSSTIAVGLLSISMGSLATCLGVVVLRYIDIPFYIVFQIIWRHLISAIIGLLPIILAKFFDMPRNVVIISFPISCIFYLIILKYRENKLFCEVLELVKLRRFSH